MAYTNIDDPSAYFQAKTYTGNATDNTPITNDGNSNLQADWIWFKRRSSTENHVLADSTRGVTKWLFSNLTNAEGTTTARLKSFDTNGFTLGDTGSTNQNGANFVAWQWKANGGTTSTNSDGNITSTVQSDTTAGFSMVTYTGNGSNNQTIGHGLGVQPSWWVVKNRSGGSTNWLFGASSILGGTSNYLKLNDTSANTEYNNIWGDSPTSSTLFRVSNVSHLNTNGSNYVAYLFADKQGYSKFGSYIGNGNTNGAFIYTGFKPAWVMVKQINTARSWQIFDNKRDGYNETYMPRLQADNDSPEVANSGASMDFVSNGFKLRTSQTGANQSGGTYIYMAFAENPFTTSTGVPCTAR
jgi:hypothetical protein